MARIDRLTRRVRWLDRYRRRVAIAAAVIVAPILIAELDVVLGADWPLVHGVAMSVMLGIVVWWIVEVGLAAMVAVWETEADNLARANGLPRAEIHRRK